MKTISFFYYCFATTNYHTTILSKEKAISKYIQMSSPVLPDRCGTADTTKSDDPLDGKPSEDAKLTHVDSCSSLPEAGDDLVPCARRISSQPNHQPGRNEEFGNDTLMQLLANASSLLTSQDLALPPNDPRVFLPTPFAPGQSAATLLERELQRKKQQENEEWNALQSKTTLSSQAAVSASTQVAGSAQSQAQMRLQTSPFVMQQQLQLGRGQPRPTGISAHDPYFQQQLQPQQRFLNLQQQLSSGGGLLNPQQINPIQRQRMYAPNAPPLSFQQSNMNDMSILNDMSIPALMGVGVGVGLPQLDAFGGTASNAMMNNFIPGFMPNNVASALAFTANNGMGMDTTRLNWLLQQHPYEEDQIPALTTQIRNHKKAKAPKERAATKTAAKRTDRGNSNEPPRPNRWTQRYNELLEFKRIEGVSCLNCNLHSLSLCIYLYKTAHNTTFRTNNSIVASLMDIPPIRSYPGG